MSTACTLLLLLGFAGQAAADDTLFDLEVRIHSTTIQQGEDTEVTVTLATRHNEEQEFRVGGFAEYFGVYILGPWGPVEPDHDKILPENWMHQEHSASELVVIRPGQPYSVTFRLSDFFSVSDPSVFMTGRYQMNIKCYMLGEMESPLDSASMSFIIEHND